MKSVTQSLLLSILSLNLIFFLTGCPPTAVVQQPMDLAWSGERPIIFPSPFDTIEIDFAGVQDTVYLIPDDSNLVSVTKGIRNYGGGNLLANTSYQVRLVLESYTLTTVVGGPSVFSVRDTVLDTLYPAPSPIDSGQTVDLLANINLDLDCGLHKLSMIIDEGFQIPSETNRSNNRYEDFIFVQSFQIFNIGLTKGPNVSTFAKPLDQPGVNFFEVTSGAPNVKSAFITGFKLTPNNGSQLTIDPGKGTEVKIPGKISLDLKVDPTAGPFERKIGKITMISSDGCILKQKAAIVEIEH